MKCWWPFSVYVFASDLFIAIVQKELYEIKKINIIIVSVTKIQHSKSKYDRLHKTSRY